MNIGANVHGQVRLVRRDRATGKIIGGGIVGAGVPDIAALAASGQADNAFTTAGFADIAALVGGGTDYWTATNLVLGINGATSADDEVIGDSTEDVTGSLTITNGSLVMSWLDDRGTGYTIDATDGIQLRKGTTASSTHLSTFNSFGGANNNAWGTNASGQPVKPTTEDWTFLWTVSITPSGTGFTADGNATRSFSRRLRGNATGDIVVHPTDDVSSVVGVPTFDTAFSSDHSTATGTPTGVSGAVVTVRRHRPGDATNYQLTGERIGFGTGTGNLLGFFLGRPPPESGANTTNRSIDYTLTMTIS